MDAINKKGDKMNKYEYIKRSIELAKKGNISLKAQIGLSKSIEYLEELEERYMAQNLLDGLK